jgi:tetratricopeptide (TPR) repeat protein
MSARADNQKLIRGVEAYENFEYQKAQGILLEALKDANSTKKEKAKIHLYLGLVHFTLGDKNGARRDFEAALKLDYNAALPPDTSPKILAEYNTVKDGLPPPVIVTPVKNHPPGIHGGPPPPPRKLVWTWVAVGIGGAAMAGAGACAYLASAAKNDFDKEPFADKANDLKSDIETKSLAANILFGVGAAGLVTGLILFFTEGSSSDDQAAQSAKPVVSLTPGGATLTFSF